ncbi:hypothetical protein D3C80_999080 [compost metagenome]
MHAQDFGHSLGVGALVGFRIRTVRVEPQDLPAITARSQAGGHDCGIQTAGNLDQKGPPIPDKAGDGAVDCRSQLLRLRRRGSTHGPGRRPDHAIATIGEVERSREDGFPAAEQISGGKGDRIPQDLGHRLPGERRVIIGRVDHPAGSVARNQPSRTASRDSAVDRARWIPEHPGQTLIRGQEQGDVSAPELARQFLASAVSVVRAGDRERHILICLANHKDLADGQGMAGDRRPLRRNPERRPGLGNLPAVLASGFLHGPIGAHAGVRSEHGDEPAQAPTAIMGV